MRVIFNSYRPDLSPEVAGGEAVIVAENVLKGAAGYKPLGSLTAVATTALDTAVHGTSRPMVRLAGGSSVTTYNFAGTAAKIWQLTTIGTDWVDLTSGGGAYTLTTGEHWDFCQYGDAVIAVSIDELPQYKAVISDGAVFAALHADAPKAKCCMTLGEHVVLGDVIDTGGWGIGTLRNGVWWSQLGDPTGWPQPGTATAIAQQSDYRKLSGDGGEVQSLLSGDNAGFIFREKSIHRMDYVGGSTMYEIIRVVPNKGCVVPHAALKIPGGFFFLDSDGFQIFDGTDAFPIGDAKANEKFLALRAYGSLGRMSMKVHPDRPEVWVSFSTAASAPSTIFVYNFIRDEATLIDQDLEWLAVVRCTGISPDEMCAFDTSHDLSRFSGTNMAAKLTSGDIQATPGRKSTCLSAMPLLAREGATAGTSTLRVGVRDKLGEAITWHGPKSLNSWDKFDCDEDGRYHRFELTVAAAAAWDSVTGLEVDFAPSGAD